MYIKFWPIIWWDSYTRKFSFTYAMQYSFTSKFKILLQTFFHLHWFSGNWKSWRDIDVEQVAEAYMLKRDHPKFKGNWISAAGASESECREIHRVNAFRCLRMKSAAMPLMSTSFWPNSIVSAPKWSFFPFLESFVLAITLDSRVRIDFRQFLFAQDS